MTKLASSFFDMSNSFLTLEFKGAGKIGYSSTEVNVYLVRSEVQLLQFTKKVNYVYHSRRGIYHNEFFLLQLT